MQHKAMLQDRCTWMAAGYTEAWKRLARLDHMLEIVLKDNLGRQHLYFILWHAG